MIQGFDHTLIDGLPPEDQERLALALAELTKQESQRAFYDLFPDVDTPQPKGEVIYARHRYQKQLEFFRVGRDYRERCFMAANRVGKTMGGAYELSAHTTGDYPHWWEGRRFPEKISAWACGLTDESTRDIVQLALLGEVTGEEGLKRVTGTGMIPGDRIGKLTWKGGVPNLVDTAMIKHQTGAWSKLGFKSYKQGARAFEGTSKHVIWLDEECPLAVYEECLLRTMTTHGLLMLTFTPLQGLTKTVMQFMPKNQRPEIR